ncbi:MAG TPA: precorrin-2 C(20)-methyltransferase [Alphaproteobacteria bacterium]|jgi:precorrin-2/cobalt-factor-2 C20-methyltransferase|nr:precorrin-2 C(20)-methyltransferase [Alphaproteobacteria bacterium]
MTGTLYGVGVGPGDPDLITLKAVRVLGAVPVIAYPATQNGESLARHVAQPHLVPGRIEIAFTIDITRPHADNEARYDAAAERIARELTAGRDVAALCEGDPLLYGSFVYLAERLARFPIVVIPGVSSVMAAAAVSHRPLATGTDPLIVIPASLPEDTLTRHLTEARAVALIKVGRHFAKAKRALAAAGLRDGATVASRVGFADERVAPLTSIGEESIPYFSVILARRPS